MKKTKRDKKQKRVVGIQQGRMNSAWQDAISQDDAKFYRLRNFSNPVKFLQCSNFLIFFSLIFFWPLICNAKFDWNSLCLDRLNNFGINNLQKLQN